MGGAATLMGMNFHDKIEYLLKRNGFTQEGLGERLDLWQSRINGIVNPPVPKKNPPRKGADFEHERRIQPSLLVKLADVLKVPVRWLADNELGIEDLEGMDVVQEVTHELPESERQILAMVRTLGYEIAMKRLLGIESAPPQELKHLGTDIVPQKRPARKPRKKPDDE